MDIENILTYSSEGTSLDFKREEYPLGKHPKKLEILKDLIAFANHPSNDDKFIIIGVKAKNGMADTFHDLSFLTDEAQYQDYLNANIEPHINFEYQSINYKGNNLAYFRIYNNYHRPYLISTKSTSSDNKTILNIGDGFIRAGTQNRRLNRADLEKIYQVRYTGVDRKEDVTIDCYLSVTFNDHERSPVKMRTVEVSVKNSSHRSISLELEFRIVAKEGLKVLTKTDLERSTLSRTPGQPIPLYSSSVYINEHKDYYDISKLRSDFVLQQQSSFDEIFDKEVTAIIQKDAEQTIEVQITLRSDDFTNGAIVKKIDLAVS